MLPRIALAASLLLVGCSFLRPATSKHEGAESARGPSALEVRALDERPSLSLVSRTGDPSAAVVIAVAHDYGSLASAAMAALLEQRLRPAFGELDALSHNGGYIVRAVVTSPGQAASFVTAVSKALRDSVSDPDVEPVRRRLKSYSFETWSSAADAAVGQCSGELGVSAPATASAIDRQKLETYRVASYSTRAVGFAAVGPRPLLDAVSTALEQTPAWPDGPHAQNEWPDRDVIGVSASRLAVSTLSIAIRLGDGARAIGAARLLAEPDGALSARVDALESGYHVEQVTAATQPRGACVRVDLRPQKTDAPPGVVDAAWTASLVADEVLSTVARTPSDTWFLDDGILSASDPRDAAAIAAWRALSNRLDAGPDRIAVSYRLPATRADPNATTALAEQFAAARASAAHSTVDLVKRVEKGQGELWMLLGSPCGTSTESAGDAGRRALVVRTLAEQNPRIDGVAIEPWITPDGVGLLAHAAHANAAERADALADRVANALGRAFSATRISERHAAAVRTQMAESLDELAPLWSVALEALAPGHPSWLDPRGTWQSITSQGGDDAENERQALLKGPLKLAVIANDGDAQMTVAARALERWLRPARRQQYRCAATAVTVPRVGEYVVETTATTDHSATALVAVPFAPMPSFGPSREAEWTLILLNRQGGWLDSALRLPGLASQAQATLLGGRAAAGFVIELSVVDEHAREAVAQVRALLARLAAGAASTDDVEAARRFEGDTDSRARFDPRRRIVDLWLQRPALAPPDINSLRRFHQLAFAPDRHIVVVEKPKP